MLYTRKFSLWTIQCFKNVEYFLKSSMFRRGKAVFLKFHVHHQRIYFTNFSMFHTRFFLSKLNFHTPGNVLNFSQFSHTRNKSFSKFNVYTPRNEFLNSMFTHRENTFSKFDFRTPKRHVFQMSCSHTRKFILFKIIQCSHFTHLENLFLKFNVYTGNSYFQNSLFTHLEMIFSEFNVHTPGNWFFWKFNVHTQECNARIKRKLKFSVVGFGVG